VEIQTLRFREPFRSELPKFVEALPTLGAAINRALFRRIDRPTHAENAILSFGHAAYDDFKELVILCESGYGLGAQKQLRSLYEHVLSAEFLTAEPGYVSRLHKQLLVHQHRVREAALKLYSEQDVDRKFDREMEEMYLDVKSEFRASWSPPIEKMAERTGGLMQNMFLYWYLMPTMNTHATQAGLHQYLAIDASGSLSSVPQSQERWLRPSLDGGHRLLVHLLSVINENFRLALDEDVRQCQADVAACWDMA
jgi:hypothetical protein